MITYVTLNISWKHVSKRVHPLIHFISNWTLSGGMFHNWYDPLKYSGEMIFKKLHSRKLSITLQSAMWPPLCVAKPNCHSLFFFFRSSWTCYTTRNLCLATCFFHSHYNGVIMGAIASRITSLTIVFSTVYSDAGQRKHQSSASLAVVLGIHRSPVNSPHKWPVTWKIFPFDDVIMTP